MGSNRKLPFGYQMEMGRITIFPEEAKLVRLLYAKYDQGDSLKTLTDWIRQQGISYDGDKLWNKNMIARILEDARYIGEKGFPQIIPAVKFVSIQEKRSKRSAPICKTEAQKVLQRKCQEKITLNAEQQVLFLLNKLILCPAIIQCPPGDTAANSKITAIETELENMLAELPVDMDAAQKQILNLASARYQAIDPGDYETEKLRRIFQQREPMPELDADLIRKTVSTVQIDSNGSVKLILKNKQSIQEKAR